MAASYSALILTAAGIFIYCSANLFWQHSYEKMLFKASWRNHPAPLQFIVENNAGVIAVTKENSVFGGGLYDGYFNLNPKHNVNGIWRTYAIPLFAAKPHNVLMIGLSSGSWAQVIANNPEVQHLTIIEINPGYLQPISHYPENISLLKNPKVQIIIDDGRRWLLRHNSEKYDLIVMNTTFHWRSYITLLLSAEFFQIIKAHLTANGIFYFNTTQSLDVVKTALSVFPYVWSLNFFIAASNKPIVLNSNNLANTLKKYTINGNKIFDLQKAEDRATFVKILEIPKDSMHDRKFLEQATKNATVITDDNAHSEFN